MPNQTYHGASVEEIGGIWQILLVPPQAAAEVLERQKIMESLIGDRAAFDKLLAARRGAYIAAGHIEHLLSATDEEIERATREGGRAKCRLKELLASGLPLREAEIQERARQIAELPEEQKDQREPEVEERDGLIERLAAVSRIHSDLMTLANNLFRLSHPAWGEIAWEFTREIQKLPPVSAKGLVALAAKDKYAAMDFINKAYADPLRTIIARVAAPIMAGRLIVDEEFAKATFDSGRPECFREAWNVLKDKGPGAYWCSQTHETVQYAQVMNDAPDPHGETYLCGSQMSGKSFILDTWFYLRLWGQCFGYIPAASGNLHIAQRLAFLHRVGSEVTSGDRSSFQLEIESGWAKALKDLPPGSVVYLDLSSDEAFSTTSPIDQYRLLFGVVRYLRARGVKVVMATHNGEFLALKDGAPDVGIYHLGVETSSAGRIRYTHRLQKGLDGSHALEVARRMNIPPHIIQRAEAFLSGEPLAVKAPAENVWRLERYSDRERELMKKQPLSFRFLWPHRSEAQIVPPDRYRKYASLNWLNEEDSHHFSGFGEPYLEPDRELGTVSATNDRLMRAQEVCFKEHSQFSSVAAQKAGELLNAGHCPDNGAREILERQKLFAELLHGDRAERLLKKAHEAGSLIWTLRHIFREENLTFPRQILPALAAWAPFCEEQPKGYLFLVELAELLGQAAGVSIDSKLARWSKARILRLAPYLEKEKELCRRYWRKEIPAEDFKGELKELCQEADAASSVSQSLKAAAVMLAAQGEAALRHSTLRDLNPEAVRNRLMAVWETAEQLSDATGWVTDAPVRVHRGFWLLNGETVIRQAINVLRETDSVYLHGFSNYLEQIHDATIGVDLRGTDLLNLIKRHDKYSSATDRYRRANTEILLAEWFKVECLARFAKEMKDCGYCRVDFNETGDFVVRGSWSITAHAREREKQVSNDTELSGGLRCEILKSPNGSSKTYYLRDRTWLVRCAMATGFAPAKYVTMPPFAKVAYLDRVASDLDRNLSAFGNEVTQWLRLPIHFGVAPENGWFIAVDEAWSSSDPHSKAALCDGVGAELLQNGNVILFSSHDDDWVRSFAERARPWVTTSHFAATISGATVRYDYVKRPGTAPSHGLEVAEAYGVPAEAIQYARLAPDVDFSKIPMRPRIR